MLGTAVPSGHSHTAGAAAGMVWQQLGVLQTFVAEVNSSLVNTDMGNVATLCLGYFSPQRGCPRVLKFCMGFNSQKKRVNGAKKQEPAELSSIP